MIDAITITDDQIRELRESSRNADVIRLTVIATSWPGSTVNGERVDSNYRLAARGRCAEILNERTKRVETP